MGSYSQYHKTHSSNFMAFYGIFACVWWLTQALVLCCSHCSNYLCWFYSCHHLWHGESGGFYKTVAPEHAHHRGLMHTKCKCVPHQNNQVCRCTLKEDSAGATLKRQREHLIKILHKEYQPLKGDHFILYAHTLQSLMCVAEICYLSNEFPPSTPPWLWLS